MWKDNGNRPVLWSQLEDGRWRLSTHNGLRFEHLGLIEEAPDEDLLHAYANGAFIASYLELDDAKKAVEEQVKGQINGV